jgi:hypothetical protein
MEEWKLEPLEKYLRKLKYYEKKQYDEYRALTDNLDSYYNSLCEFDNPLQVKSGFIHDEPDGIKGLDQRGVLKKKLRESRLYVFPDVSRRKLYLLTIGDKGSQAADIQFCREYVRSLKDV